MGVKGIVSFIERVSKSLLRICSFDVLTLSNKNFVICSMFPWISLLMQVLEYGLMHGLSLSSCVSALFHIAIFYYLPYILTLKYACMVKEHNSYFFLVKVGGFVFKVEAMVSLCKELFLLKLNLMKLALINLALIKPSLIPDLRSTTYTQTIRVSKTGQRPRSGNFRCC